MDLALPKIEVQETEDGDNGWQGILKRNIQENFPLQEDEVS